MSYVLREKRVVIVNDSFSQARLEGLGPLPSGGRDDGPFSFATKPPNRGGRKMLRSLVAKASTNTEPMPSQREILEKIAELRAEANKLKQQASNLKKSAQLEDMAAKLEDLLDRPNAT